ncbi:hypothetical protein [Fimbriimonas ginsengisoli]|uniref:hypothetical protein n=1 Tax=Fimbriimonas ginsengisoli TaxID=1005039 RepID=UPI0011872973|nr:hypothetical protein [Fimbriimonas ginsengisoli]
MANPFHTSRRTDWTIVEQVGSQLLADLDSVHPYQARLALLQDEIANLESTRKPSTEFSGTAPALSLAFPHEIGSTSPNPPPSQPRLDLTEYIDHFVRTLAPAAPKTNIAPYASAIDELGGLSSPRTRMESYLVDRLGSSKSQDLGWYGRYAAHRQQQLNYQEHMRVQEVRARAERSYREMTERFARERGGGEIEGREGKFEPRFEIHPVR